MQDNLPGYGVSSVRAFSSIQSRVLRVPSSLGWWDFQGAPMVKTGKIMKNRVRRSLGRTRNTSPESKRVQTTLYDLVEAVMDEVGSGERGLTTLVVLRLLDKSRSVAAVH